MRIDVMELGCCLDGDADLATSVGNSLRRYRFNKLSLGGAEMAPLIEWHQTDRTIVAQYPRAVADADGVLPAGAAALALLKVANSLLERYGLPIRVTSLSEAWQTVEGPAGDPVALNECMAATGIERAGVAATWMVTYHRDDEGLVAFDEPQLLMAGDGHVLGALRDLMGEIRRTS